MRICYETNRKSLFLSSHPKCCEFFEKNTDGDFITSLVNLFKILTVLWYVFLPSVHFDYNFSF